MSSALSNILLEQQILLESGTNELEVLVFSVAGSVFGINVAKVREVLPRPRLVELPRSHKSVRGLFQLRDQVIPVVSLVTHLLLPNTGPDSENKLILTDFNQQQTAFLVDRVEQIHRLNWNQVQPLPYRESIPNSPLTGIVKIKDRTVMMLDFETIIDQVTAVNRSAQGIVNHSELPRGALRILLADDSPTVRQAVSAMLSEAGYRDTQYVENGQAAWTAIEATLIPGARRFDLVVSDVEMPQVDGMHLTKRIKEHAELCQTPVVLYSSIVTPDNLKKGKAVGADHQISKPDLRLIVDIADRVLTDRIALNQLPSVVAATLTIADGNSVAAISTSSATIPDTVDKPTPASAVVAKSQPKSEQTVVVNNAGTREAGLPRSRPPRGIDAQLWITFYQELEGRTERLQRLTDAAQNSLPAVNEIQETARILHTIKSASAVVPLVAVRDITHEIESQLEPARSNPAAWPVQLLTKYCGWLRDILDETEGLDAVLEPSYARKAVLM